MACNAIVCGHIWDGDYRGALRAYRQVRWSGLHAPEARALLLINVAEALYNLGRWRRAARLMSAVQSVLGAELVTDLVKVGLAVGSQKVGTPG